MKRYRIEIVKCNSFLQKGDGVKLIYCIQLLNVYFKKRSVMDSEELKSRHQELEGIIKTGFKNYIPDERLRKFKKEKLRIKQILNKEES